jgi:hypothetical protein
VSAQSESDQSCIVKNVFVSVVFEKGPVSIEKDPRTASFRDLDKTLIPFIEKAGLLISEKKSDAGAVLKITLNSVSRIWNAGDERTSILIAVEIFSGLENKEKIWKKFDSYSLENEPEIFLKQFSNRLYESLASAVKKGKLKVPK